MTWVDVAKVYDSVDHRWLHAMFTIHRFPKWFGTVMKKLAASWNTRVVVETNQGLYTSEIIRFKKGLPQGDALCPALFTLCLKPITWKLRATEGYKLSRPVSQKVTHLLYIDGLKAYAASDSKLERVLRLVKDGMECIGLKWNENKCAVAHVRRGRMDDSTGSMNIDDLKPIRSLGEDSTNKFLGVS